MCRVSIVYTIPNPLKLNPDYNMASNTRNLITENQNMATNPTKIIIKKKHILSTPEIKFKNTKDKGDAYEIFIKHLLLDSGNYKMVHLWKDVPEAALFDCGIMDDWNTSRLIRKSVRIGVLPDFGTDLLIMDNTDKYSIVQCKHYDDSKNIDANHIGTFLAMVMRYHHNVNSILYATTTFGNFMNGFEELYKLKTITQPFNPARYLELLDTIYKPVKTEANTKQIPFDYQLEAITALTGKSRTVCQLPCGCGKTLIAIKLCEAYNQTVIIAPLKSYCEQNLERFTSQMDGSYAMMIIDSDGDGRNIDKIQDFVKKNEKICLFATFKSVDIINALVNYGLLKDYYVVIDEFHNLSINDILEVEDDFEDFQELENSNLEVEEEPDSEEEFDEEDDIEEEEDFIEEDDIEEDNNTEMYKLLHSNARILFMSATPRLYGEDIGYSEDCDIDEEIFGNIDYKMEMHAAITSGKICDYIVYVPTLSIDKTVGLDKIQEEVDIKGYDKELLIKARFIIRGMMNNGGRRCIIYLQTKEECRKMNTILADVGKNYFAVDVNSNYLISDLGKEERKLVLKEFVDKDGYNFICSVDILNECIDIPECDSIFIAYPSKSKIRNIQRVCRANRKDKKNVDKVASIYVWADEYKDDLVDFISHLKEYDEGFSFTKVKRLNVNGKRDAVMRIDDNVKESKSLEGLVVGVKGIDSWFEKLEEVKKYIDDNGRRPTQKTNAKLDIWISNQIIKFKTDTTILKVNNDYLEWIKFISNDKYKKFFVIDNVKNWKTTLLDLKEFINTNNAKPNPKTNKYLSKWIQHQMTNFKNKKQIMKDIEIYQLWDNFINDDNYKKYFDCNNLVWINKLEEVKKFINKYNARPTKKTNRELSSWISSQVINSKRHINIMKNNDIYNLWNNFVNNLNYKKYFDIDKIRNWKLNLEQLKNFIDENNARPQKHIILYAWTQIQICNFKNKLQIMKNEEIYNLWQIFIEDINYKKYFMDYETEWFQTLEEIKKYLLENKVRPTKQTDTKLSRWIIRQQSNFENKTDLMTRKHIYISWNKFVNDDKFKEYFISYEEQWKCNFSLLKQFIDNNNKRPTVKTNKFLSSWLETQIQNYKNKKTIMINENIYKLWIEFINDAKYRKYILTTKIDIWKQRFQELNEYIVQNNKLPTKKINKLLEHWFYRQKHNYSNNLHIMKNKDIKIVWEQFINSSEYKKICNN